MRRKLGLIIVLVVISLVALTTGYLMQKDEAQAINVFAKTSVSGSSSTDLDKIWSFNQAEADKWTKKADMPTARRYLSTSVVNGKIYAIGGSIGGPVLTPDPTVEEYNPIKDTWTKKADMPIARWGLSTATVNGKIYAIGGDGGLGVIRVPLSTVEEYDPSTNTWTKKADMTTARFSFSTSVVNGKIYAIGGPTGVEEYDPVTDRWIKKADMPAGRFSFSTSVVNGEIYAIGGFRVGVQLSTVEKYNPLTDTWTKKADMPTARDGLSTSVVNGRIYAIGGARAAGVFVPTVEEYDPLTDKWTRKADMPAARFGLSTSAVDGNIYAIGGQAIVGGPALSTVEEYNTGFVPPQRVEAKGKLPMSWGKIKAKY